MKPTTQQTVRLGEGLPSAPRKSRLRDGTGVDARRRIRGAALAVNGETPMHPTPRAGSTRQTPMRSNALSITTGTRVAAPRRPSVTNWRPLAARRENAANVR
jgi:hypothetical protein